MKCCYKCNRRHPGCHADCPDYAKEKAKDLARKEKIKKAKDKVKDSRDYVYDHYHK